MAELKGANADRFVEKPDPRQPIILIHGPDHGRVSMRAKAILSALAGTDPDPMTHIELDSAVLESDPARLAEEADSVAMFGGHKTVFVRMADPKGLVKPIEVLLDQPPQEASIIIAAGDLKKSHPLRSRIEKAAAGAAIACYAADRRDIGALLAKSVKEHGLTITSDAQNDVLALLGADHALSRAEIEKLCLYAREDGHITEHHVHAILVDSAAHGMNDVGDSAFAGHREAALSALDHALKEGLEPSVISQGLLRHGQNIERIRLEMDRGQSADTAMARARPPIFFKRKAAIEQALRRWSLGRLRACLIDLDAEVVATRLDQSLKATRVERQILRITALAGSHRR
jgi:DNA polymerase-3 subunit delta